MTDVAARIFPIEDPQDVRVAPFRDVKERDLVGRAGQFIAEGEVVLRGLLRSKRHRAVSVLIAEKRVEALRPLLAQVPADVPIYTAGQAVMDAIAGFHMHRGILALGERTQEPDADGMLAQLPERALVLVLVGIANHDNVGGLFRNAAAFGVDAVLLDATSCDPLYRKSIRVSVGAALEVPFVRLGAGVDALDLLERHGFSPIALTPSGPVDVSELQRPPRAAVIVGAEGPGLPADILTRVEGVRIAMAPGFDSLNVATSSGIVLHRLADNLS
ncbi:TrmH family RNA methyltransferase [Terrihabitans sp. B22-R8]|uniref:TrmH family RNA methyltransferase n=1 Tax=Terrihabitans sp. B22-R8 TaxID=3425128 RepID=UPI00403C837F